MAYDTGSNSLTIFMDEVDYLIQPETDLELITLETATGVEEAFSLPLEIRVLTENHQLILRDWHDEAAAVIDRCEPRLSSKSLNGQFFLCERPWDRRLFAAQFKTPLYQMM